MPLGFGDLWPEAIATGDALAYAEQQKDPRVGVASARSPDLDLTAALRQG